MKSCEAKNNIWTPSAARPGLLICSARPAATPLTGAADWWAAAGSCLKQSGESLIFPVQVLGGSLPLALCLLDFLWGPAVILWSAADSISGSSFHCLSRSWSFDYHTFISTQRATTTTQWAVVQCDCTFTRVCDSSSESGVTFRSQLLLRRL